MDRFYRVFVSSTFTDLEEERREVMQALLELDCMPAGMELFPSSNAQQWDIIERVLKTCDYYVVVVGGRYGSISEEGISYTEKEYELAETLGIPILGFLHGDPDSIPAGKSEATPAARKKLEAFRGRVQGKHIKYWMNAIELGAIVSRSFTQEMKYNPRDGWVSGANALTPELESELRSLRAENQNRSMTARTPQGKTLQQGDDKVPIVLLSRFGSYSEPDAFTKEATWDGLLKAVGDRMITEAPESVLRAAICDAYADSDPESGEEIYLTQESWVLIIRQLRALGYIELGTKDRPVTDITVYWKLAPAGEERLLEIAALYRSE
ncbi:DUF4062 domain-containing protein [Curtobacterium sp. NPDC098951]|uniref:DUF4062 domain-containing protein n=1 Tax=Curtobacterium sp. NPDC098951 TaxID=3363974 RepID=UPI00380B2363